MKPAVLDTGALIAFERRVPRLVLWFDELVAGAGEAHVPAGVVAQAWRGHRRQHPVARLLRATAVRVHALDEAVALRVGVLLARSGTSDVVDAHVALLGRALGARVLTSDPDDLRRLDGSLDLLTV